MHHINKVLSIVIPAYNEGKTIHLILNKIINLRLDNNINIEIIIINDCSTDDTQGVILEFIS